MIGQDYIHGPCDTCKDTGRHPSKRKTPCPGSIEKARELIREHHPELWLTSSVDADV